MSYVLTFLDILLMLVVCVDTLGFIVHNRKNPLSSDPKDYLRLCYTWVFFLVIKSLSCCCCAGLIGNFMNILSIVAKAYISIPMFHGAEKLFTTLVEQNAGKQYIESLFNVVKQRVGGCQESQKTE